jgi:uncharacterized membrane protein YqhA
MKTDAQAQQRNAEEESPMARALGRSRFVVLLAVVGVLIVALSLFLQGALLAVTGVWETWQAIISAGGKPKNLSITVLQLVHVMLEAVVFYLIGVGFYSLFIAPLNLAVSLGVETLSDLEEKVISTVIAIMAVTFLEHFIAWKEPLQTLQFGAAMAVVTASLVWFQRATHLSRQEQKKTSPNTQARAQRALFQKGSEEHEVEQDEVTPDTKN